MGAPLKIVVTGPESSGKSSLVKHLAEHFKIPFVPEYARIYLEREGSKYDFDTVSQIAKLHWKYQQDAIKEDRTLFLLDTDLINFMVWQEVVFGKHDPWIDRMIEQEAEHRYLICYPDIPWEPDPLRENRNNRSQLFDLHLNEIQTRSRPYRIVKGEGVERLAEAQKHFLDLAQGHI